MTRRFHVNLTNREFPHSFVELGSTVVISNMLEANRPQVGGFNGTGAEQSAGICQAYFMQNVLPTTRGYSSVSFQQKLPPIAGINEIPELQILRGSGQNVAMHAALGGAQYVFDPRVGSWQVFPLGTVTVVQPFYALVKERTFIFYPELGLVYEYDFDAQDMVLVAISGLDLLEMQGICAAGPYLIFWDASRVYWSAVLDPTDFVPSLATGAGSTAVLDISSKIVMCAGLSGGLIIYTATNAVAGRLTNNVQFPFLFREIRGSAGIADRHHLAANTTTQTHITWTASGFQQLSFEGAEYAFPELSDGIIRGILSELDPLYLRPILTRHSNLDVRVNFASNRWLCISLRTAVDAADGVPYRLAYVLDLVLGRWGRLDVPHRQVMEYAAPEFYLAYTYQMLADNYPTYGDLLGVPYSEFLVRERIAAPQPNENFGIVLSSGAVYRVALAEANEFAVDDTGLVAAEPRIFLGKFKVFRSQGAKFQNFRMAGAFAVDSRAHGHDQSGAFVRTTPPLTEHPRQPGTFYGRLAANAFSLELIGQFHLTDLVVEATEAGMRNQRFDSDSDVVGVYVGDSPVYVVLSPVVVEAP